MSEISPLISYPSFGFPSFDIMKLRSFLTTEAFSFASSAIFPDEMYFSLDWFKVIDPKGSDNF